VAKRYVFMGLKQNFFSLWEQCETKKIFKGPTNELSLCSKNQRNYQRENIRFCTRNTLFKNYKPKNTITKNTKKIWMKKRQILDYKNLNQNTWQGGEKRIEEKTNTEQGTHHQEATWPTTSSPPIAIGSSTGSVAPPTHRRSRGYQSF
jgi:hypothetical protein